MEVTLGGSLGNKLIFFTLFFNIAMTFLAYGLVMNLINTSPNFTSSNLPNSNLLWQPPVFWYGGCITTSCQTNTLNNIEYWFIPSSIANATVALEHLDILGFVYNLIHAFTLTNVLGGFIAIAIALVLLLLSLGVGGGVQLFASGYSIQISDQGARFAQSLSVVLFLLAVESIVFMNWINLLPNILSAVIVVLIYLITLIGGYLRALEQF